MHCHLHKNINLCSVLMFNGQNWSGTFLVNLIHVPGNGACFIRSVKHCLSRDVNVNYTIDEICDKNL